MDRVDIISMLARADRDRVLFLQHHLLEVLTGLPAGSAPGVRPRAEYAAQRSLASRVEAKAAELPYRLNRVFVRDHRRDHRRDSWIEAMWTLAGQTLAPFSLDVLHAPGP